MARIRRVVVGVADSPGSLQALRFGAGLARQHRAALVAVTAWVPPGGDYADRRHPSTSLRAVWRESARKRQQDAIGLALGGRPADLKFETLVLRGEPGPTLVCFADRDDDVLVIGAGRRGWLRRWLCCRVGRYCLAHADCPVLAVPPSPLAKAGRRLFGWASRHRGFDLGELNQPSTH
jgi:nucleotide-binding universal stress UspA family protein